MPSLPGKKQMNVFAAPLEVNTIFYGDMNKERQWEKSDYHFPRGNRAAPHNIGEIAR
jgi:hypothetical protein